MDDLTNLLFVLAPALLVAGSVYLVIKRMLSSDMERRKIELVVASRGITIPMRLQAYERLVLLLERITFESLVMRVRKSDMRNHDLQLALLSSVRAEFEHNLSQQLYISVDAWEAVRLAKESIVTAINEVAMTTVPEESSMLMARALLERNTPSGMEELTHALQVLKSEAAKLL